MAETVPEKILESAVVAFAEKGFEGARVARIAIDAGVNKALIYYHFNSKKDLYIATINHLFKKAAPKQMGIVKGETREVEEPDDYMVSFLEACYFFYSHRNSISEFYDPKRTDSEIIELLPNISI